MFTPFSGAGFGFVNTRRSPDGTHYRYQNYGFLGIGANVKNSVEGDNTFKSYLKNGDRESSGFVSFSLNGLGQVAYNLAIMDSLNGNKIRAADLFKHKHHFAGGAKGLR